LYTQCHTQREQMLKIWLLCDFYFFLCACIVAKLYISNFMPLKLASAWS